MLKNRLFALLMAAVLLLGLLAGCAAEPVETPTAPTDTPASTDTPAETPAEEPGAPTNEPADEPAETPTEEPVEAPTESPVAEVNNVMMTAHGYTFPVPQAAIDGVPLPLVDEPATISLFMQWTNNYIGSPMEMYVYQEMEERTGVTVDYTCVSAPEQFQIMYASQDYDDIIKAAPASYVGGVDKAVEDEIYVDAADYAHLTPTFNAWQTTTADYARDCKTDSGITYFNSAMPGREPAWCGAAFRGDWLDDCGLEAPVTYDDWHTALTAFKEQKGATKPLALNPTGYDEMGYALIAGYGVAPGWYQVDGKVKYGVVEDGMLEYVTMMNQWYAEGLVDPDFPGYDSPFGMGGQMYAEGTTGAWDWMASAFFDVWPMLGGGGYLVAVENAVKNEGDTTHLRRLNGISGAVCFFITTAAVENGVDELCAQWIDYRYTLDCSYLLTFGEEGLDWTYNEDGVPAFTDHYYNHPDGKAMYHDSKMQDMQSSYYIWWREFDQVSDGVMTAYNTWEFGSDAAYNLPMLTLTAEESEAYSSPYTDIQTYVQENIPLFIRGDRSLDTWDAFVEEIYSFGLEDCIAVQQAALDRYNAR